MASMKHRNNTTSTETISANAAGVTSATVFVIGPKQTLTYPKARGVYVKESADTYRWVKDEPLNAAGTELTSFSADTI